MSDRVRVLRIIEYIGDREWVEYTLAHGAVPPNGTKDFNNPGGTKMRIIHSKLLGDFAEKLPDVEDEI
jgi:hypothetical protein